MEYVARKYNRTLHFPQSQSVTSDDKVLHSVTQFENREVIITEKMDGENTTIYCGGTHARSIDSKFHPSRSWMKSFAATISPQLDPSERVCGEYMFARHSITYENLETYFYGFAWFIDDELQSWDDTVQRFTQLGIIHVPVLYRGMYAHTLIDNMASTLDFNTQEGFVMRVVDKISDSEFSSLVGKYVRKNHVQTDKHWMHSEIIKNGLKS